MSYAPKAYLKLSLADVEIEERVNKADIVCIIFLNDACIDKLYFNNSDYQTNVPLLENEDKIGLIFQSKETGEIIGCIGFCAKLFLPFKGKSFTQWVTLFDTPEDDLFDGEIGEHDEDTPRTLLNFRVENFPQSSNAAKISSSQLEEKERNLNNISNVSTQQPGNSMIIYDVPNESFRGRHGASNKSSPQRHAEQLKTTPSFENFLNERDIKKGDLNSQSFERQVKKNENASPSRHNIHYDENIPHRKSVENQRSPSKQTNDTNMEYLEQKISDLITTLQTRKNIENKFEPTSDFMVSNQEYEEVKQLLEIETEKSKELEKALHFAENQFLNSQKLYDQLENTRQEQYEQALFRNRNINEENKELRTKINELQLETIKIKDSYSSEIKNHTQKFLKQAEYDKTAIDKYLHTIENLERLNKDLNEQIEVSHKSYHQERETNKKYSINQEDILKNYKQNLEAIKEKNSSYFVQIQNLSNDKLDIEKKNLELEGKLKTYELQNSTLENELEYSKKEIERKNNEIDELKIMLKQIKGSIEETLHKKDQQILSLVDNLGKSEENLKQIQSNFDSLLLEKEEWIQQNNYLKSRDHETDIYNLEALVNEKENTRKSLQEALNQAELRIKELLGKQEIESTTLQSIDREKAEENEKKVNELIAQYYQLSKEHDDLKFENVDLKIKCDELEEIKSINANLKERLSVTLDENQELKENLQNNRHQLLLTAAELVKQTNAALHQSQIINSMNDQMTTLDESLKTAFGDIRKLHMSLDAAKRIEDYDNFSLRRNDEIDQKLAEMMNKTKIPIKFIRIGEGLYVFGSRRVHVKIINGKLAIRCGGGYMMLEEFIRLYAHQEILKLKSLKGDQIHYTDMDYEEIPPEVRMHQIIRDEPYEPGYIHSEFDQSYENENKYDMRTSSPQKVYDRSGNYTEGFRHSSHSKLEESLDEGKQNLIYDINPPQQVLTKKGKRVPQHSKTDNLDFSSSREISRSTSIRSNPETSPFRTTGTKTLKK